MSDEIESKAAFGRRVGLSGQRVGQMAARGYVVTDDGGKVRIADSLRTLRDAGKLDDDGGQTPAQTAADYGDTERQAGAIIALQEAQRRWPALAALAAAEHGVDVETARAILSTFATAAAEDGGAWLSQAGVRAFADADPPIWRVDTVEPEWGRIAKKGA